MIDTKRLIAEVAAKHNIRLDSSDPALCLITLNELVLENLVEKIVENVRTANKDFEQAAEQLQTRAGTFLAQQISVAVAAARTELGNNVDQATAQALEKLGKLHQFHARFAVHWIVAGVMAALVTFAGGILLGMTFR
jgi:CHASE3 domain sensor protein